MNISLLRDKCPRVPWLSHMRVAYIVFKPLQICLPEWLYHSTIPPAKCERARFSTFLSLATLVPSFRYVLSNSYVPGTILDTEFIATR